MISKFVLAVPVAALNMFTVAAGMVATSDSAEASCRRVGLPGRLVCDQMSTPRPDRPNQQKK